MSGPSLALLLFLRLTASQPDTLLARAESLLVLGRLPEARRIAERLQDRRPRDPQVLMVLGRIHLAWPVIGRYAAESLFSRAAELSPGDPEPLYYLGLVGIALGGDDGEQIARRGLVPVIAMNPEYRDAWTRWMTLYRGNNDRRAMIASLVRHPESWKANYWRARLLHELGRYDEAEALFERLTHERPDDPGPWAWLAQTRFAAGRDVQGAAAYDMALAHADRDSGEVLWRQIRGIASPEDRAEWVAGGPRRRAAFMRRFWAARDPDLETRLNERLGEHFRRMAQAQRMYALLHPNSRYFRSRLFRALSGGVGAMPGGLEGAEVRAQEAQCTARPPSVRDAAAQAGLRDRVDQPRDSTENLEDGLDDRGRIFLRHGPPDYRQVGSVGDETWCYFRPDGTVLRVSFVRHTGGYGVSGDMVVTPMVSGEAESANLLLTTDHADEANTLTFRFWPAAFRAADRWSTDLIVIPDSLAAVATLVDDEGIEAARDSATGRPLHLVARPGHYLLLIDGNRAGAIGRYRGSISLPDYGDEVPIVSSILLAHGTAAANRDSMALAAPYGLVLPAAEPLRVYTELYNLGRVDDAVRYVATYRFERTDGVILAGSRERTREISFTREAPFTPRIIESLVVDPGRLPAGRYRLNVEILDAIRGVKTASSVITFELR